MSSKERTDARRRKKANISPDCLNLQVDRLCINSCQTLGILLHPGLCSGPYCACQSAGQLQRGKFKNGFLEEPGPTQWDTVQGLRTSSHNLQYKPKQKKATAYPRK
ncbi:hypothetical protein CHARACLAT_014170 [Characodon lateralis]|uniref:Uncharacterized protein n=1 Tax=Characodon lateralis TaxID=208331 RepID=A0ABU7D7B9_9TELE|nr:hypothetical protein [Characodon lateralis]